MFIHADMAWHHGGTLPKKLMSWIAPTAYMSMEGKLACNRLLRGRALHVTFLYGICHARFLSYGMALSWALCPAWASRLNSNKPNRPQARAVAAALKGRREGWRARQATHVTGSCELGIVHHSRPCGMIQYVTLHVS